MLPILLSWGPIHLGSYAVLLALGFAAGTWLSIRRGLKRGADAAPVYDLALLALISSIIGARFFHFVCHYRLYANAGHAFAQFVDLRHGGLMVYGGLAFAVTVCVGYLRHAGLPVWRFADILAPGVPLGLCLARIGCFLNGCCWGKPTSSWLGVTFPATAPVYTSATGIESGTAILPAQLFEAAAGLAIAAALLLYERYTKPIDGLLFGWMLALISSSRFLIERYRYREPDMSVLNGMLSGNQVFSLIFIIAAIAFLAWRSQRFRSVWAQLRLSQGR